MSYVERVCFEAHEDPFDRDLVTTRGPNFAPDGVKYAFEELAQHDIDGRYDLCLIGNDGLEIPVEDNQMLYPEKMFGILKEKWDEGLAKIVVRRNF